MRDGVDCSLCCEEADDVDGEYDDEDTVGGKGACSTRCGRSHCESEESSVQSDMLSEMAKLEDGSLLWRTAAARVEARTGARVVLLQTSRTRSAAARAAAKSALARADAVLALGAHGVLLRHLFDDEPW